MNALEMAEYLRGYRDRISALLGDKADLCDAFWFSTWDMDSPGNWVARFILREMSFLRFLCQALLRLITRRSQKSIS
jgi:hypothetical protein